MNWKAKAHKKESNEAYPPMVLRLGLGILNEIPVEGNQSNAGKRNLRRRQICQCGEPIQLTLSHGAALPLSPEKAGGVQR